MYLIVVGKITNHIMIYKRSKYSITKGQNIVLHPIFKSKIVPKVVITKIVRCCICKYKRLFKIRWLITYSIDGFHMTYFL